MTRSVAPTTFVYVIQGDPNAPVKIGIAKDVQGRIDSLQTGNPQQLRLLHVVPGDYILEWNYHQRLKKDRVLGEWFDGHRTLDFLDDIERMADRMVAVCTRTGRIPHYSSFDRFDMRAPKPKVIKPPEQPKNWRRKGPAGDVTVRYVEPSPKMDPEEAKVQRELVRGCSRVTYLGPPDPLVRRRISPSHGFGN
jgi:hypothetical protein